MDHQLAVTNQAAERYVLGDMSQEERDAFEEHFFTCASCADDVRATSEFAASAKAIFQEKPDWAKPARRRWVRWSVPSLAWAGATAVCLLLIGYQNLAVFPELKGPRSLTSNLIFDGATRSALPTLHQNEALHFQMPWDQGGPALVELRRDSRTLSSGRVEAPPPNQPLEVYFPNKLKPGRYNVIVRALQNGQPTQQSIENLFEVIP